MNHLDKYMDTHTRAFLAKETCYKEFLYQDWIWKTVSVEGEKKQENRRNNSSNKNQNHTKKN